MVTRCRLSTETNWATLRFLVSEVDAVVHVAGVNRGSADDVSDGNVDLAGGGGRRVAQRADDPRIVFANSVQSGNDTPYGQGKDARHSPARSLPSAAGSDFVDVLLPNLFGEHGRPELQLVRRRPSCRSDHRSRPPRSTDRPIDLLHVQQAAQSLLDALELTGQQELTPPGVPTSVQESSTSCVTSTELYATGDIPPLLTDFDVDLFNTLRASLFPRPLSDRALRPDRSSRLSGRGGSRPRRPGPDVRVDHPSRASPGASTSTYGRSSGSWSSAGRARISLRRLYHDEVVSFDVDGRQARHRRHADHVGAQHHQRRRRRADDPVLDSTAFRSATPDTYPEPVGGRLAMTTQSPTLTPDDDQRESRSCRHASHPGLPRLLPEHSR